MYRVTIRPSVRKALSRLPRRDEERVAIAIARLSEDPRPPGCLKLTGQFDLYRIRVGRYRVIYEVRDHELIVLVVRVAKRDEQTY